MDFTNTLVRDIASERPDATALFRQHKIDFCCHGDMSLSEAAARQGLDLQQLEAELGGLSVEADAPARLPTPELIAYILERYHEAHRRDLPELIGLAVRVERRHAHQPRCPHGLADLLMGMAHELEVHQQKEEILLFPMMIEDRGGMLAFPIARMTFEHDEMRHQLAALGALTQDFTPPPEACRSWRALSDGCRKFDAELREHVHLENNVLFQRFAQ
jgi:regulator of cell morphogenesis and NO signaling